MCCSHECYQHVGTCCWTLWAEGLYAVNARTLALDAGGTALFTQPEMVKNQQKLSKDVNLVCNWIWRIEFQGYCSSALFLSWFSFLYVVKEWSDLNRKVSCEQSRRKKGGATSFHECILTIGEVWRIIFKGSIYLFLSGWNIA